MMKIMPVGYDHARVFIKEFHYLGTLPKSVKRNFALFVDGNVHAVACYGPIHAPKLPKGLMELRRLAKREGSEIVLSKFLSGTLRQLKKEGILGVLSWADPEAGHHGGIYQATNWIYSEPNSYNWNSHFIDDTGNVVDHRQAFKRFGTSSKKKILEINPTWKSFLPKMKFRYLMPLNADANDLLSKMNARRMPYPKPDIEGPRPFRIPGKFRKEKHK
jgi:hypothetical protein